MSDNSKKGFGSMDPAHARPIQSKGGKSSSFQQDMSELGHEGGKAAQTSGHAHKLTEEERSRGGSSSEGNFKNDPDRASEVGKKGGRH